MEKQQTAVKWLINELDYETISKFDKQLGQAKEMEKEQQGYSEADMREAIVKSALSNIDNMIERCDKIIEQFKNK